MSSAAASQFRQALDRARILRREGVIRGTNGREKQIFYHASLAATVAGWETYTQRIVRTFFAEITSPASYGYHALHTVALQAAESRLERFHTPNWENTRNLLAACTGYDPIGDWTLPSRGLGAQQVREYLNEILKVRHSFAHGHSMPSFEWNRSPSGNVRLTTDGLRRVESFFVQLVRATDKGIARRILNTYGRDVQWS